MTATAQKNIRKNLGESKLMPTKTSEKIGKIILRILNSTRGRDDTNPYGGVRAGGKRVLGLPDLPALAIGIEPSAAPIRGALTSAHGMR